MSDLPPLVIPWGPGAWDEAVDAWMVTTQKLFDLRDAGATWDDIAHLEPEPVEPGLMSVATLMATAYAMGVVMGRDWTTAGSRRDGPS